MKQTDGKKRMSSYEFTVNLNKGECEYQLIGKYIEWRYWERNCVATNETDFVITFGKCPQPTPEMFEYDKRKPFALRFNTRDEAEAFLKFKRII